MTTPSRKQPFLKFIAYLQVIGIILVVLGHSFHEYPDGNMGRSLLMYRMMYSFRMPLFMFVSGFLMVYTTKLRTPINNPGIARFTKSKIKRLLVPFITLTIITFIPRSIMSGIADDEMSFSFSSFCNAFIYNGHLVIPFFWFLQASFVLLIFNYAIITLGERKHVNDIALYSLIVVLFIILPFMPFEFSDIFSLNEAARLGIYFAAGAAYCRFSKNIDRFIPWTSVMFFTAISFMWAALFFLTENTPFIMLCSLIGIMMWISVAKIMERHNLSFIDHLIGANYMIFLLSWYCNVMSQQVLAHFISLPWWCHTLMSLFSGIYIPWLFYRYLLRHPESKWVKISAFLLGQSLRKSR